MTQSRSTDAEIAAHIAKHGVTRCPAAFAAPTTVELTQADVDAHRARNRYAPAKFGGGWVSKAAYEGGRR